MTTRDTLRLRIADQPRFRRDEQDQIATGNTVFYTEHHNLQTTPAPLVRLDGTILTVTVDYTLDLVNGVVTFIVAPTLNDTLIFEYYSTTFTDDELDQFLSDAAQSVTLAAAQALYTWSTYAAQTAQRTSVSGGGGPGSVSITTDLAAVQLRLSAQAFLTYYQTYEAAGLPSEGLTEVSWTEANERQMVYNWLLSRLQGSITN